MLCLLLLNALFALANVRRVAVTRVSLRPIYAGEEELIQLRVSNISNRLATIIVEDLVGEQSVRWLVPGLSGGDFVPCYARRTFSTRGKLPGFLRVSSGYPIGLLSFDRLADTSDVIVLPAIGNVDIDGLRRWAYRQAGNSDRSRKVLRRVTTDLADVRGVRPYRPGDSIRSIHWRSSARRGELMVREFDTSPAPDLILVVEPWLPTSPTPRCLANLEAALSLAATIAVHWSRVSNTQITLVLAGEAGSIHTTIPTDSGVREVLRPLAHVTGSNEFLPLDRDVFDRSLTRAARIVVSSRTNSPYATVITQTTGRLFVAASPDDHLPWYQPPREGKH